MLEVEGVGNLVQEYGQQVHPAPHPIPPPQASRLVGAQTGHRDHAGPVRRLLGGTEPLRPLLLIRFS
jgi:hypothetical protein